MMGREFNNEIPDCVINSFGGVKSESMMLLTKTDPKKNPEITKEAKFECTL